MNEYPYGSEGHGATNNMASFLVGALVGAGVALLLAPAAGGETRRRITDTARRWGEAAKEKIGEARHGMREGGREPYLQGSPGRETTGTPGGTTSPGTPGRPTP